MEKYYVMVVDDEYSERETTFKNFLNQQIEGVEISYDIVVAETPFEFNEQLDKKAGLIDAFFIDVSLDKNGWSEYGTDFKKVLQTIDQAYEGTKIPPCFLVSKHWNDTDFLANISTSFGNIHALIHPSKFYRIDDLENIYNTATLVDAAGVTNPKRLIQEREFIKSEIEKTRREKCNATIPVDAVIMFAVPDEKNKAYSVFGLSAAADKQLKRYGLLYQEANIDQTHVVFVTQSEMGMTDASRVATSAILAFRPKIIIMIGICAGKKKSVKLGDIIIAKDTFDYAIGKLKRTELPDGSIKDDLKHRTYHEKTEPIVEQFLNLMRDRNTAESEIYEIRKAYNGALPDRRTYNQIYVAPIASGPWVVDTRTIFDEIEVAINDKCFALDMEAYAVAHAAKMLNTPSLVIKVVQDYADGKKEADEATAREFATFESAEFARRNLKNILMCFEPDDFVEITN